MMKKRIILVGCLIMILCLLSSCAMMSGSSLEAMFQNGGNSGSTAATNADGDTVTISREEYEQYQSFSELAELLSAADANYYREFDRDKMLEYAAKGLMAGLDDPYSFYYNAEEFAEMWEDDEGNYTGIGVLISANYQTQLCTISRVFEGSPAQEADVHRGDILYRVGEDLYVNADNLQDAVDIMRGVPGTDVSVTFLREGEEITKIITRREVVVNRIASTMLDDQVGYISFYEFAGECDKEFETALNQLLAQGAKGLVIDLRDNPGGWVEQARYVADLFMDEGEACYLVYRGGLEDHSEYRTKDGKADVKLVILINENSASSSEILTGALRDKADALVVGVKSYGKGIIQGVWPVGSKGAGVQMTIAQYFTPNGYAVHGEGIEPDVVIELPEDDNGMYQFADLDHDVQLKKAYEEMTERLK